MTGHRVGWLYPLLVCALGCGSQATVPPASPDRDVDALIDIGGRKLHLHCEGTGRPLVLLETGLGEPEAGPSGWGKVLPSIAAFTRVCAYDRAGLGTSDSPPSEDLRSCADLSADTYALVEAAGLPRPMVYVGHSLGGFLARFYRDAHPDDVAGVVFVSASFDGLDELWERLIPPESLANLRKAFAKEELVAFEQCARDVSGTRRFGDMPYIVMYADRSVEIDHLPEPFASAASEQKKVLLTLGDDVTELHATRSGHYIQTSEPELVADAVRKLVDRLRRE